MCVGRGLRDLFPCQCVLGGYINVLNTRQSVKIENGSGPNHLKPPNRIICLSMPTNFDWFIFKHGGWNWEKHHFAIFTITIYFILTGQSQFVRGVSLSLFLNEAKLSGVKLPYRWINQCKPHNLVAYPWIW